jgi:hypothetical protein
MTIGRPKPDGRPYTNTEADWLWLSGQAGKAARWLGYLPFDQIVDQRNSAPTVRIFERPRPRGYLTAGVYVDVPSAEQMTPSVGVEGFTGTQPYKLVLFGEKSSLADVLSPVALHYQADLYLPTGEISDTLMYQMAKVGAEDGRPMVVMCFSDADPAGWQMPLSISRKLQAFKAGLFPKLQFQVYRAALTPEQVGRYGLLAIHASEGDRTPRRCLAGRLGHRADRDRRPSLPAAGATPPDRTQRPQPVLRRHLGQPSLRCPIPMARPGPGGDRGADGR